MNARLLTCLLCLVALTSHSTARAHDPPEIPKLAVRGLAELEKPADQLRISIGVVSEGKDATQVLQENSTKMNAVVEAVKKAGVSTDEYETGRFRVRPKYTRRPRQADPEWSPQIIGYEVVNTINIKTKQLDLVASIIENANKAGANSIDSIAFDLSDPRQYRAEAIAVATKHALEDANVLADAASLRLVRVMSITLDSAQPQPPAPMSKRVMMASGAAVASTPIAPGDVTIRATVNVVYEVASKE
ncbi:MAG: SIMPL domain-containing protein [Planctomycetota bacterium]|nr:SIMPL domain-containing protein [Planctomycetota bacterium]